MMTQTLCPVEAPRAAALPCGNAEPVDPFAFTIMAEMIAARHGVKRSEMQESDPYQGAWVGLLTAIREHQEEHTPGPFSHLAYRRMQRHVKDGIRRLRWFPHAKREVTKISLSSGVQLADRRGEDREQCRAEAAAVVERALALLPPEQQEAIRLIHLEGRTHAEAAKLCDPPVARHVVYTRAKTGLQRLRRRLVWTG